MHTGTQEPPVVLGNQGKLTESVADVCFLSFLVFGDVDLHRWLLSKTVKGDADDDLAKYDGLSLFSVSQMSCMI